MKLFLKTHAIIASIALLLCVACSEEETAERVKTPAEQSEVTVTAGNGKIQVEWIAPADDNVAICVVEWSGAKKGSIALAASQGSYLIENLSAGDYTVSVQNYGDILELDSPAVTQSVTVYDYTSYTTVPSVKSMFIDGTTVVMEWNEAPEDCTGVVVAYTDVSGNSAKTTLSSIDTPVVVTNVMSGSAFTYSSAFQPDGGFDAVMIDDVTKAAGTFPTLRYNVLDPLNGVEVRPGDFKMRVSWETTDSPEMIVVTYDDGETIRYHYIRDFVAGGADSEDFDVDATGTYAVAVRSVSADGNVSEVSSQEGIEVYDYTNFFLSCPPPTFSESVFFGDDYEMRISWTENDECADLSLEYVCDMQNTKKTLTNISLSDVLSITDCMPGSDYVATATYYPAENSLDELIRTTNGSFPDAAVWKCSQDRDDDFASYDLVWSHYPMAGDASIDFETFGLTDEESCVNRVFDGEYANAYQYVTLSDDTAPYQTLTIDLGRIYKLSKFSFTPYYTSTTTGSPYIDNNVEIFNLYGTSTPDPLNNSDYNQSTYTYYSTNAVSNGKYEIPVLTNWETLLTNATISTSTLDSSTATSTYRSFTFDIPDTCEPVRYIKIQFVQSFENDRTNDFRVNEIDLWHRGVWDTQSEYMSVE